MGIESYIGAIFGFILDLGMVFGPLVGYFAQFWEIHKLKNSDGFSTRVSVILIVANITRVFFWLGKRFNTVLLFAAIAMIIAQMALLHITAQYRSKYSGGYLSSLRDKYTIYYLTFAGLSVALVILQAIIGQQKWYIESLGAISAFVEAMLGVPQFYKNLKSRSTEGLSVVMILCWLIGDTFKAAYYSKIEAPIQLVLCACFQIAIDVLILWQFWLYKKEKPRLENVETQRLQKTDTVRDYGNTAEHLPTGHDEPLHILSEE